MKDHTNTIRTAGKRILAVLVCGVSFLGSVSCKKTTPKDGDASGSDASKIEEESPVKGVITIKESDPFFNVTESELQLPLQDGKKADAIDIDRDEIGFVGNTLSVSQCHIRYEMPSDVRARLRKLDAAGDYDGVMAIRAEYEEGFNAVFGLDGKLIRSSSSFSDERIGATFENQQGETLAIVSLDEKTYLVKIRNNGDLEKIMPLEIGGARDAVMLPDGSLVCAGYDSISILSPEGKLRGSITEEHFQGQVFYQDGKCYGLCSFIDYKNIDMYYNYLMEIDVTQCIFTGEKIKVGHNGRLVKAKDGVYIITENGISKTDLKDASKTEIVFSWSDTDYDPKYIMRQNLRILSDSEFYFISMNEELSLDNSYSVRPRIVHVSKMDKNPYAGKKLLSVGIYMNALSREEVIRYNTDEKSECRVAIHDYYADMLMDGDIMNRKADLSDKVGLDMVSGTGPDILVNFSQFSQFYSEKILLDLNPFIDAKDGSGLERSEYFDNILRAQETGGKLYHIPLQFSLSGLVGNHDLVGDVKGQTYDQFMSAMDSLPADAQVFYHIDTKEFLERVISESGEDFIDYEGGKVNFESEAFKKLLEITKKYAGYSLNGQGGFHDDENAFKNGMLAWYMSYLHSLRDYARYLDQYGDSIVFSGFPGNHSMTANVDVSIGISANSYCQKESWDFICYLLENSGAKKAASGIPLSKAEFNRRNAALITESKEQQKNWEPDPNNPGKHPLKLTEDMAESMVSLVESVNAVNKNDPSVMLIILEEVPAYLLDQRSMDDVCKNIQNRATILVQERG